MITSRPAKTILIKDYLLLLVLVLIVYWPLSLNIFSLKNDALVQYLAFRYHLSEAIQHGHFPFWSPYLYTGFPIHADMQGEVWNPFVILISLFTRYNMSVLQWEVLIYLYLASVGMYRLLLYLGCSRKSAICCSIAFMCCGYMTDSVSIIPWIPSGSFIPFVLLYFLRLLRNTSVSNAVKFSLSLSLMFLVGYPSFFIVMNYVLFAGIIAWMIKRIRLKQKDAILKTILLVGFSYIAFLLFCSPAIVSYYEFLPYYSRGSGLSYTRAATNPFVPYSLISYILPNLPSKAAFLNTDLSMRNAYVGLFILLFFFVSLFRLDSLKKIIVGCILLCLLFSFGDLTPVQKLFYNWLPMMNTFRHPGTMRVFTSVGIIILAAYGMDAYFKSENRKRAIAFSYVLLVALAGAVIYFLINSGNDPIATNISLNGSGLKKFLQGISYGSFGLYLSILQLVFVMAFVFIQHRSTLIKKSLPALILLNSIVFAWIALPFTVVSQYRTKDVNQYIASFPDGYPPIDMNASVESEVISDSVDISVHGYHNFYNKKITIQDHIITPTLNADYGLFLRNLTLRNELKGKPFAYITDSNLNQKSDVIRLQSFSPNRFAFDVQSSAAGKFILFQQFNHNWKVKINGNNTSIEKVHLAFMQIAIPPGHLLIEWKYNPVTVYIAMFVSAVSLIAVVLYFVLKRKSKPAHA